MIGNQNAAKTERSTKLTAPISRPSERQNERLGLIFGVNPTYIWMARSLYLRNRDLFAQVHRGDRPLKLAFSTSESSYRLGGAPPELGGDKEPKPSQVWASDWVHEKDMEETILTLVQTYRDFVTVKGDREFDSSFEGWISSFSSNRKVRDLLEDIEIVRQRREERAARTQSA